MLKWVGLAPDWVLFVLGAVALVVYWQKCFGGRPNPNLPPGPRNIPLFGALFSIKPPMHHTFTKWAEEYGPVVYFRLGYHNVAVVTGVEAAEEVLRMKDVEFSDRPNNTIMTTGAKYIGFDSQAVAYSPYNPELAFARKVCISELFTAAKLKSYEGLRTQELAIMITKMRNKAESGELVMIKDSVMGGMTNVLCMLMFGKRFATLKETDHLRDYLSLTADFKSLFVKFNLVDVFPFKILERLDPQGLVRDYKKIQVRQMKMFGQILEEHRLARKSKNYQPKDFVDYLLTQEDEGKISEGRIMGTLMSLMTAGIGSSAKTIEWAFIELMRNPQYMKQLQEEVDSVVGPNRAVEEADFSRMPFLQAVFRETLRLHTVGPLMVPHFNEQDNTIGGYHIPAKTAVFVNIYGIGRDPKLWKDSLVFNPNRFMSGLSPDADISFTGSDYRFTPFGSGRRFCLGIKLGLIVVQLVIASYVHAFDFAPPKGMSREDISIEEEQAFEVGAQYPLGLLATPRPAAVHYRAPFMP